MSLSTVAACNTTSDIDTTLGSVAPVSQQQPLPPPAVPNNTQSQSILTVEQAAESTPEPLPNETPAPPAAQGAAAPSSDDDLIPQLEMRNTGTYPNINVEREPSLNQFTPQEQARLTAYMTQLREQHQAGTISTAQFQRQLSFLQNLARTHSRDALRQIGAL
ncbi:MAG: hypothetical protein AAFR27_00950 [Pseudomonadota bacterium]